MAEASRASGGAQPTDQLGSDPGDVSGAQRQHHVTRLERLVHCPAYLGASGLESSVSTGTLGSLRNLLPTHSCDGLLPGRINLGHEDQIGSGKCLPHCLAVGSRAGVQVRLKDCNQPAAGESLAGRGERRGQLRRVVRVIVDHRYAAEFAQALEPASHTLESGQSSRGRLELATQCLYCTECRNGIPEVVQSWNSQRQSE